MNGIHEVTGSIPVWSTILTFGPATGAKPYPLLHTDASELNGQLSPDDRWIAYQSSESGREEVYIQTFPSLTGKWQISNGGGHHVRWRLDGKELFFLGPKDTVMAAAINADASSPHASAPKVLFEANVGAEYGVNYPYAVSDDGQRILVETAVKELESSPMTVVINWTAALKK